MEPIRVNDDEDIADEVKELLEMTRENNEILHGMRRRERIGNILKVFYIGFIILSVYGAYIFALPYIKQIQELLTLTSNQKNASSTLPGMIDPEQVKNIINLFNKTQSVK